ncbi:hypothetical protein K9L67_02880 [Candidatus Woesearchaeota archaeon]|nr:hypothetical protein [Candidatus Woesearchaeota archaeon]MCF8013678.1 hypothetical protein [Candidatus Woesearchaeota archaeon]
MDTKNNVSVDVMVSYLNKNKIDHPELNDDVSSRKLIEEYNCKIRKIYHKSIDDDQNKLFSLAWKNVLFGNYISP